MLDPSAWINFFKLTIISIDDNIWDSAPAPNTEENVALVQSL